MERKRLVLDANILIRGCLGLRVKCLIATYADQVDFYVAEANVTEAAHYIAELAKKKRLDVITCTDTLLSLMQIVQQMGDTMLESAREEALTRIRDPNDGRPWHWHCNWSVPSGRRIRTSLAPVLQLGPPIRWRYI